MGLHWLETKGSHQRVIPSYVAQVFVRGSFSDVRTDTLSVISCLPDPWVGMYLICPPALHILLSSIASSLCRHFDPTGSLDCRDAQIRRHEVTRLEVFCRIHHWRMHRRGCNAGCDCGSLYHDHLHAAQEQGCSSCPGKLQSISYALNSLRLSLELLTGCVPEIDLIVEAADLPHEVPTSLCDTSEARVVRSFKFTLTCTSELWDVQEVLDSV